MPINSKITSSNNPSRLYCHTKVMLLPSNTLNGSGGFFVNVGANSTKQNKKLCTRHRSFSQFGNMTRESSAKLFYAPRETLAQ